MRETKMTSEFEKRLEEALEMPRDPELREACIRFSNWAYQQGIRDVLEKLRGAKPEDFKPLPVTPNMWADWLEREMLGEKK